LNATPAYFADTAFWIALAHRYDQHHTQASAWGKYLIQQKAAILTTEAVLWEWMNALAAAGTRRTTAEGYRRCHQDPNIEVVPFASDRIAEAVRFYEGRADKDWSLTDCLSFLVMEQHQIPRALTSDRHFQQAGFEAVLLVDPPATA
jgi:uncharacterized protein